MILTLDGGLSNVLEAQGCNLNHKLWTASIIKKNPEAIVNAHLEYINAGADIITTSSYQASIQGLKSIGNSKSEAREIILETVRLAERAAELAKGTKPHIAASIGPYGAFLADGSEYTGGYGISTEELNDFHKERIEILDGSSADFLACETIPCIQEAKVLSKNLAKCTKPSWMSFSFKDEKHINDGSKFSDCIEIFLDHPKVFAIGVNCTKPEYVSNIIRTIRSSEWRGKIIAYPNSGEVYCSKTKSWADSPSQFLEFAQEWKTLEVDIIGGCCRIGPAEIKELKQPA